MSTEVVAALGAVGAFLIALAALWRSMALGSLLKGTRLFLLDWFGEPARDGYDGRPSFPSRMTTLEHRTQQLNHDVRDDIAGRLADLANGLERLTSTADANSAALQRLDDRVTDHRRRNEQQVRLLREAVNRVEAEQLAIRLGRDLATLKPPPPEDDS